MWLEAALWNKTSLECSQTFWTRCFKPSLECKQMVAPPLSLKWIRTSSTTTTSLSSWESVQTVRGYVVSSIVASQAVGSCLEFKVIESIVRTDWLCLFQPHGFPPNPCRCPKRNCAAQARGWEDWAVRLSTSEYSDNKPFLLSCQTQLNSLTSPSSADNSHLPITELPHSLWKLMLLLFPQPEFCLMSPASPCVTPWLSPPHSKCWFCFFVLMDAQAVHFSVPFCYCTWVIDGPWQKVIDNTDWHVNMLINVNILMPKSSHKEWNEHSYGHM